MPPEKDLCGTISGQSVLLKKEPILVSQHGFTLLEVLVAFAIMALSVGLLYQALGSNARQTADTTAREHAALLAESLLAMHETVAVQGQWYFSGGIGRFDNLLYHTAFLKAKF